MNGDVQRNMVDEVLHSGREHSSSRCMIAEHATVRDVENNSSSGLGRAWNRKFDGKQTTLRN